MGWAGLQAPMSRNTSLRCQSLAQAATYLTGNPASWAPLYRRMCVCGPCSSSLSLAVSWFPATGSQLRISWRASSLASRPLIRLKGGLLVCWQNRSHSSLYLWRQHFRANGNHEDAQSRAVKLPHSWHLLHLSLATQVHTSPAPARWVSRRNAGSLCFHPPHRKASRMSSRKSALQQGLGQT